MGAGDREKNSPEVMRTVMGKKKTERDECRGEEREEREESCV